MEEPRGTGKSLPEGTGWVGSMAVPGLGDALCLAGLLRCFPGLCFRKPLKLVDYLKINFYLFLLRADLWPQSAPESEESATDGREEFSVEGLRWVYQVQGTLMLRISPPRKGHPQQIFRKKSNTAQAPFQPSSHCSNPRRISVVQHRPPVCAKQLPTSHTGNLSNLSKVSKSSWFLCAQDILLPHTWWLPHHSCMFCRCSSTE